MELKPITRQEKIIAGENLTPITRREKFLKQYGGGSGSGGGNILDTNGKLLNSVLPEGYPYSETTYGDTLTWDGNTEGLESGADMFYKVSDVVPTLEELANGGNINLNGTDLPFTSFYEIADGALTDTGDAGVVVVITRSNATIEELGTFPTKGVYLLYIQEGTYQFTINGYTGFETTVVKPLGHKFLPEGYPYKEVVKTVLLPEQTIAFSSQNGAMGAKTSEFNLEEGKTYFVNFDGENYECVCWYNSQYSRPFIGNGKQFGLEDTGEPFLCSNGTWNAYGDENEHTISVTEYVEIVVPMAEEFLSAKSVNVYACYSDMADDGKMERSVSLIPEFVGGAAPESDLATMQELLSANTFTLYEGQTEVGVPAHLTVHDGYVSLTFYSDYDGAVRTVYSVEYEP